MADDWLDDAGQCINEGNSRPFRDFYSSFKGTLRGGPAVWARDVNV
jgi:hypothetical protein